MEMDDGQLMHKIMGNPLSGKVLKTSIGEVKYLANVNNNNTCKTINCNRSSL